MITQYLDLNIVPVGIIPVIHVKQYDNQTSGIVISVYNDSAVYSIPSGSGVLVNGTKPDGHGFSYSAASYSGNQITLNVTTQMTAVAGEVPCEIKLSRSGQTIASLTFILMVEKSALSDDTVISDSELPLIERAADIAAELDTYIQETREASTASQNAAIRANNSALTAADKASEAATYDANVRAISESINAAKTAANTAAENANSVATAVAAAAARGDYKGEKGDKGDPGDAGIYTPVSGIYALSVDNDGNLWCYTNGSEQETNFEYDSTTGNLYYIVDDSEPTSGGTGEGEGSGKGSGEGSGE